MMLSGLLKIDIATKANVLIIKAFVSMKKHINDNKDIFIIIHNSLYHIGSSLKELGKRCFAINKIDDNEYLERILEKIYS